MRFHHLLLALGVSSALVVQPAPPKQQFDAAAAMMASIAAAALVAAAPMPAAALIAENECSVLNAPSMQIAAASNEDAALAKAIAKANKLSKEAEKDISDSVAKRGRAAKAPANFFPSVTSTDVSVALRSGVVPGLKDLRLPSSLGITLPALGPVRVDFNIKVEKVTPEKVADADIVVTLPNDLIKAGKKAVGGNVGLAFDAGTPLGGARFDVDVSTPRKGEADLAITSPAIPKLPLQKTKGLGRFCFECGDGGEQSDWFVARNLGNGIQFYGNAKTGVSQFDVPKGF